MIPHFRPQITEDDIRAVTAALRSERLSSGEYVARLEQRLSAEYAGAQVVAVSSGTAALYLALTSLDIAPGSDVVIPAYTCNSLYAATAHAGLGAVCADVGDRDPCITVDTVNATMTRTARAIIAPHTLGYRANIASLSTLGLPVIEDCAHALGAKRENGTSLGLTGLVGILSFYATKLLPSGEGGACVTKDEALAGVIRRLRNCDEQEPDPRAFNLKMTDLSAALALSQLDRFDRARQRRDAIARRYDTELAEWSYDRVTGRPPAARFRYLLHVPDRADAVIEQAASTGVTCRKPVFHPLHTYLGGACPAADRLHAGLVSLPLYPALSDDDAACVAAALRDVLRPR